MKYFIKRTTLIFQVLKNFINHFKIYVDWIEKKIKLKNDLIVDVGSNDRTCLLFKNKKFRYVG